ncbi:MAG: hypothetical protein IJC39_04855, partial [Firmicutes bacterium]|nr:hypothetical protein [Bacillota bacterium]
EEIYEAELIGSFLSPDEQSIAAGIFARPPDYRERELLEKAINQELRLLKRLYINERLLNCGDDAEMLMELLAQKARVEKTKVALPAK